MNYFGKYHSLFEAGRGMPSQNEIADAGMDVEENNIDNGGAVPNDGQPNQQVEQGMESPMEPPAPGYAPEGEVPMDGELDDANYMQAEAPQEPAADDGKYKKMKLFCLFRNMMNYTESLLKTIENVDLSTLDDESIIKVEKAKNILNSTLNKIKEYMIDIYSTHAYEQGIYIYVLLRSELLAGISIIRETLALNKDNDEKTEKN